MSDEPRSSSTPTSGAPARKVSSWLAHSFGWVPVVLFAWFAIFGIYEVVERLFLQDISDSLIYVLHIVRGTATSFILAGIVAWYILRRPVAPALRQVTGLRTIVAETQLEELIDQTNWIVRLRWIAIAGVFAVTIICRFLFHIISEFSALALVFIGFTMVGYNALFAANPPGTENVIRVAFIHVFLDLVSLTLMIYFSGGINNPFFLFYLFHIVIAGILLHKGETYLVTLIACSLFCCMVILEELAVLPSFPLLYGGGAADGQFSSRGRIYVSGLLGAFVTTACCTAYFTTTIMDKLRTRGIDIFEASEILSQERAKTEDIVRNVGAGLLITDLKNRVVWANDIAREWFGSDILDETGCGELWQGGEQCESCPVNSGSNAHGPVTCERSIRLNGVQRFFLTSCSPLLSADGAIDQMLVLIQDISHLKEMEIQIMQTGRMAAVGQLAAGIAHELNNPLAIVASSAEILSEMEDGSIVSAEKKKSIENHLRLIGDNVYRCKNIIQNLLAFSRGDDGEEAVNIPALLDDTIQLAEGSSTAARRRIVRDYARHEDDDSSWSLPRSRPLQIQQALLNLLMNAFDATDTDGVVTVSAEKKDGGMELSVADNGAGISPDHLGRIFDPFFTTKPVDKGTGLGLYISHQIIESLSGKLTVESWVGEGSVFKIWLPGDSSVAEGPLGAGNGKRDGADG